MTKQKNSKVTIGLLSHNGNFHSDMLISLDHLVKHSVGCGVEVRLLKTYGSVIANNRNKIVASFLEQTKDDYLLFIDSDMVFSPDALITLLKHNKDIVSGLAVSRKAPFNPVAKMLDKETGVYSIRPNLDEGRFYSDLDMVGAAFLLIHRKVLEKMKKPHFACPPYFEGAMGEDVYFCREARAMDYQICVDTALHIGHIGEMIYYIDHHFQIAEQMTEVSEEDLKDSIIIKS